MRAWRGALALLALPGAAAAEEVVTVPWRELRDLYRQQVVREMERARPPAEAEPVCAMEETAIRLTVGAESATASVVVSGRVLAGKPGPIPILPATAVIARVAGVQGGNLLRGDGGDVCLRPQGEGAFQVALDLLVPVREDGRSKLVTVPVPESVRSGLTVTLPAGLRLVGTPGLAGADGTFHAAGARSLEVRFDEERALPPPAAAELDALTRVELLGKQVVLTTAFLPARAPAAPVVVRLPAGAGYIACSLKGSWIREVAGGAVTIAFPPGAAEDFTIQCALGGEAGEAGIGLALPAVEGNAGREGDFALAEPEDGEVAVEGALPASAAADGPALRRAAALLGRLPDRRFRIPRGGAARLAVRRFDAVGTPELVLDDVRVYTAFEEGGGALTVLRLAVPPSAGPRLRLRAVPGAEIWSASVNGRKAGVYALEKESWIVPLAAGEASTVELAWLRRGPKLGLQGRLEAPLPATGLPARNVHVAVVLPPRVELVSVEGDLAAAGAAWEIPESVAGRRHYFRRAFDRGEGMSAAFLYKEPVEQEPRR